MFSLNRSALLVVTMIAVFGSALYPIYGQTSATNAKKSARSSHSKKKRAIPAASASEEEYTTHDSRARKLPGDRDLKKPKQDKDEVQASRKAESKDGQETVNDKPIETKLTRAGTFNGDVRKLKFMKPVRIDRPEREAPDEDEVIIGDPVSIEPVSPSIVSAAAPSPIMNFPGLDFLNWGAGRPPDTNGDVGPTYFIQTVNTSIGIFRKSDGVRVAAFTFNNLMSQGSFGNLCDTNNFGDPVVLYDSFEDRWIITDFAFTIDGSGNVTSNSYQCFAASKTGDPVAGGWNFYSTVDTDFLGDYPKFGIWPDGIYWSANMFAKPAGGAFQNTRVRAMNKAQMYAGAPTVQVVTFNAPSGEFTILPGNARLQSGTPPAGTPNYFSVVAQFTNAISTYKFHADWNKISTSTFTGPFITIAPTSWSSPPTTVPAQGGNNNDSLSIRLMVQNQYSNIGGVESTWNAHTVLGGVAGTSAVRYYQVNVTGGTIGATTTQAATHVPDATNRYMPSLAVDHSGDMMLGYSASTASLFPAIRYAGRLALDPVNTLPQTETSLIEGTGSQNTSTRWGDYSAMTLDPDGCTFWLTNEYYATTGGNWQTRIGSTTFPTCLPLINGNVQGTVTSSVTGLPIGGATVSLGSRTTTTDAIGFYSFAGISPGTYPTSGAAATGYDPGSVTSLVVNNALTTVQDYSLSTAVASACLTATTQADFQTGVPTNADLTTSPGDVTLAILQNTATQNTTVGNNGVGITTTTWGGQTFTPTVSGTLTKVDINLFCSGCSGIPPNLTLSLRATSAGLPTGADIATGTVTGFTSGAAVFYSATFASPPLLTAGTMYALVIHPNSAPIGTYALTRSGTASAGSDVYAGGTRVTGSTTGTVWSIPLTGGVSTDAGFRTYIQTGFAGSGDLVSTTIDSNPVLAGTTTWNALSWTASTPANTAIRFQVAASNSSNGPFNFVGPDTTAATFFTTSGSSLSQFNGFRYLEYRAFLTTSDSTQTPILSDVTLCYTNPRVWTGVVSSDWNDPANWSSSGPPGIGDTAIIPASGVTNDPVNTTNATVASLQLGTGHIVDTGANTLTVGTCSPSAVTGGSSLSYVRGSLTRCIDGSGSYQFPVGTANGYSPVLLGGIVGSGNFNVSPVQAPLLGTDVTQSVLRNWALTPSGGVTQADVTLTYLDADVPLGANEAVFQFVRRSGTITSVFAPSSVNTTTNTFTLNGVSSFSSWSLGRLIPTAAGVTVSGRVFTASGVGIRGAVVSIANSQGVTRSVLTNSFGYYSFDNVTVGQAYAMSVKAKGYQFVPRIVSVNDNLAGLDFVPSP